MPRESLQVAICGGIAVGKTTLAERLTGKLQDCLTLIEHPETNPYLADFYVDMHHWAFHSRIAMLAMFAARYRTLADRSVVPTIVLMDRCIHELITFATLQYASGNLSDRDFSTYRTLHDGFLALTPPLDMVIYLSCSPTTALERIRLRGRSFEAQVKRGYLDAVAQQYQTWLAALPRATRVLRYSTDEEIDLGRLASTIEEASQA
jgi:deoxyadenosine/deoxycytidine kinase